MNEQDIVGCLACECRRIVVQGAFTLYTAHEIIDKVASHAAGSMPVSSSVQMMETVSTLKDYFHDWTHNHIATPEYVAYITWTLNEICSSVRGAASTADYRLCLTPEVIEQLRNHPEVILDDDWIVELKEYAVVSPSSVPGAFLTIYHNSEIRPEQRCVKIFALAKNDIQGCVDALMDNKVVKRCICLYSSLHVFDT